MTTLPMPTGDFAPQPKALPASPPKDASQLRTATLRLRALRESGVKLSRVSRLLGGSPTPIILGRLAGAMTAADYDVPVMIQGVLRKKTCIGETECIALNEALARMWKDFLPTGAKVIRLDPPKPKAAPRAAKKAPAPPAPVGRPDRRGAYPRPERYAVATWLAQQAPLVARRRGITIKALSAQVAERAGVARGTADTALYGAASAAFLGETTLANLTRGLVEASR